MKIKSNVIIITYSYAVYKAFLKKFQNILHILYVYLFTKTNYCGIILEKFILSEVFDV